MKEPESLSYRSGSNVSSIVLLVVLGGSIVIFVLYDLLKNPLVFVIGGAILLGIILIILRVSTKARCYAAIQRMLDGNNTVISFDFDNLSGTEFEKACVKVLSANGFSNIHLTKGSGDYGVDILCDRAGDRYAIQCKRYNSTVGIQAVQQVESGCHYYNCNKAVVMTNGYFTEAAIKLASKNGIILWNRDFLYGMAQGQINGKTSNEARLIGYAYRKLFKNVYKRDIRILSYDTQSDSLKLEYTLKGDTDGLEAIMGKLDDALGYHHVIEESEKGCKMVVTR